MKKSFLIVFLVLMGLVGCNSLSKSAYSNSLVFLQEDIVPDETTSNDSVHVFYSQSPYSTPTKIFDQDNFMVYEGVMVDEDTLVVSGRVENVRGLYKLDLKSKTKELLLKSDSIDDIPSMLSLSPDHKSLAYVLAYEWPEKSESYSNLYVLNLETGTSTEVVTHPKNDDAMYYPSWSPDGSQISFLANFDFAEGNYWDIYLVNKDGSNLKKVSGVGNENVPVWLPSGDIVYLAYKDDSLSKSELYRLNPKTSTVSQLTDLGVYITEEPVKVSPDGNKIAFTAARPNEDYQDTQIYTVDLATDKVDHVYDSGNDNQPFSLAWSPNGQLSFSLLREYLKSDIYILDLNTQKALPVTQNDSYEGMLFFAQ